MIDVKKKIVEKRSEICLCSSDSPYQSNIGKCFNLNDFKNDKDLIVESLKVQPKDDNQPIIQQ